MSTRQLRKLRRQQDLLEAQPPSDAESENDDYEPIATNPRGNAFAGFAALGDMGGDDDESEEAEQVDEEVDNKPKPKRMELAPQAKAKKAKKKKKKKAKKLQAEADTAPAEEQDGDQEDEIDRALKEVARKDGEVITMPELPEVSDLLRTESQRLKVMNEMRSMFGREAIYTADTEVSAEANQARRRNQRQMLDLEGVLRRDPRQTQKMSEVIVRRNPFIQYKETWPVAPAEGLTMKMIKEDEWGAEYAFAHETFYVALEMQFFQLVETYNDQGLLPFLRQHPYHISSLIQMSKIAKREGNAMLMGDLIERALFTFGRSCLSSFRKRLEDGKTAWIDFSRPENRQFYLAGYNYIKCLIPKGAFRTALEWTKLLLKLGQGGSDCYGLVNHLHVLAIKAHEAKWFLDLHNYGYFMGGGNESYIQQSIVPAMVQLGDTVGARAALARNISTLPWLYSALFSALNLDTPKSIWGIRPRDSHDELYTKLYIHMAKDLWSSPKMTSLLTEIASSCPKPDIKSLPESRPPDLTLARFIYLEDTPALLSLLPPHVLSKQPNYDFDPLPPLEQDNVFSNNAQRLPWQQRDVPIHAGIPTHAGLAGLMGMAIPADLQAQFEELAAAAARVDAEGVDDPGEGGSQGVLARMLNFMFGRLGYPGNGAGDGANMDTDDDMPALLPADEVDVEERGPGHGPGWWRQESDEDTDDEMPALEPPPRDGA